MGEPVDVEAPQPLDVDGVFATTVGTGVWAALLVLAIVFHHRLSTHGHGWWVAAAACGFGLGLLGIAYCLNRRRAIARG